MNAKRKEYLAVYTFFLIIGLLIFGYYSYYLDDPMRSSFSIFLLVPILLAGTLPLNNIHIGWKIGTIFFSIVLYVFYFMGKNWYSDAQLVITIAGSIIFLIYVFYEGVHLKKFKDFES
ncbi:hypothetical protein [Methanolapillus ohkumae]|uniref:DUF2069 domain-containing protein n=1 Tax=Methanolapillus ohkumae TaxID=3028298 RepID=A0AA96ZY09_9EURY|nr:hypothetical protein MsAm2_14400 [Methanosarcinaceae archaeon Am2]